MRIGLVLDSLVPARGGVEQWTWQLIASLLRLGHEVHVVAFRVDAQAVAGWHETGRLTIHCLKAPASRCSRAMCLQAELERLQLDVIHDMGVGWYCDVFQPHGGSRPAYLKQTLLLLPRRLRPLKQSVARWLPRYRQFDRLTERQYSGRHRVIAVSQMVRDDICRYHAVAPERLYVIHNGVDCERFRPEHRDREGRVLRRSLAIGDDETVYLLVAHNFRLKGVPCALEATRRLVKTGEFRGRFLIVGGRGIVHARRRLDRLGLSQHVQFIGPVENTVPYYAAADVYVHPTFYDPCSLVVLEALASGLPVITTRFNGAAELIRPSREGIVLQNPADAPALAHAMQELTDPDCRQAMGRAARQVALQHTFEHNVREIVQVYEETLRSPVPRGQSV